MIFTSSSSLILQYQFAVQLRGKIRPELGVSRRCRNPATGVISLSFGYEWIFLHPYHNLITSATLAARILSFPASLTILNEGRASNHSTCNSSSLRGPRTCLHESMKRQILNRPNSHNKQSSKMLIPTCSGTTSKVSPDHHFPVPAVRNRARHHGRWGIRDPSSCDMQGGPEASEVTGSS